ncbi:MAG TPA: methyltransferase [Bacteroidota bacterium]|nr:methyltransferase [Bacteroidota bacterium]
MTRFRIKDRVAARLNLLPEALYDAFPAVLFGRVLVLASRFGIFDELNRRAQTPAEIARSLSLPLESAELMLSSLNAAGYLKKRRAVYSLAPQAAKWLVRTSPHSLAHLLEYLDLLHHHWLTLEDSLRRGRPLTTYVETFGEDEWRIYTDGMMDLAKLIIPRLLPKIALPAGARSLLDLGGSHGLYAIELCRKHPGLKATIADFPPVLSRTGEIVREYGLGDRVTLLPCNIADASFPPHDVVLAFNILHGFRREVNRSLFEKIASALNPGGLLLILDQFKDERSRGAARMLPMMVGVNLLNEIGGTVYGSAEVQGWCREAGLLKVRYHRLSLPGVGLISARGSFRAFRTEL